MLGSGLSRRGTRQPGLADGCTTGRPGVPLSGGTVANVTTMAAASGRASQPQPERGAAVPAGEPDGVEQRAAEQGADLPAVRIDGGAGAAAIWPGASPRSTGDNEPPAVR
jgi:hypothetical protein